MIRKNWFLNAACKGNGAKPVRVIDTAGPITWGWSGRLGPHLRRLPVRRNSVSVGRRATQRHTRPVGTLNMNEGR